MTIEDMFKTFGIKKVFDKNGYLTRGAMKVYNKVAQKYFNNDIDQLDKLCEEEKCFK